MKHLRSILFVLIPALLVLVAPSLIVAEATPRPTIEPPAPSPFDGPEMYDTSIPPLVGGAPYPYPIIQYQPPPAPAAPDAPVITVWYGNNQTFGQQGTPQQWLNIVGSVAGATATTTLSYSLNGGPLRPLSIGSDMQRLWGVGDFNIELDYATLLPLPATNSVVISAVDGASQDQEIVTVSYQAGIVPTFPHIVTWTGAPSVQAKAQIVDGQWHIDGDTLRTNVPGYDRLVAIGDMSWQDYEMTVPVTVHSLNTTGPNSPGVGLIARWRGHFQSGSEQPNEGWRKLGTLTWFRWNNLPNGRWEMRGNGNSDLVETNERPLEIGKTYIFKLSVQSSTLQGEPSTYRFKFWELGQQEPIEWFMQSVGSLNEPVTGSLVLVAHQADVSFGTVEVRNINNVKPSITIQPSQHGQIIVEPFETSYPYGTTVTIRALGDSGWRLGNWTGQFSGAQNPIVFDITKNVTVGATFVAAPPPTLDVNWIGQGSVTVSPANGPYQYGQEVTLTPKPAAGHLFAGWTGGYVGSDNPATVVIDSPATTITASFIEANANSPVSDDFNACALNTAVWTFVNPVGDGSYQMNGTQLLLNVPAGQSHNIWVEGNRSVRMMQPTENIDFEIVTRFESTVSVRYQMQGILVEQDANNFLRFEVHFDGSHVRAYAARFVDGNPTAVITTVTLASTPGYLRVTRVGDQWSYSFSNDGATWTSAGSFGHQLTVAKTGVFAGNHGGPGNEPAHTAIVDYFFNNGAPIVPEDGNTLGGLTVTVNKVGEGTVTVNPPSSTGYNCGAKVTLTATAAAGWSFIGWGGDLTGAAPTQELTISRNHVVTATFAQGAGYKIYLPVGIDR